MTASNIGHLFSDATSTTRWHGREGWSWSSGHTVSITETILAKGGSRTFLARSERFPIAPRAESNKRSFGTAIEMRTVPEAVGSPYCYCHAGILWMIEATRAMWLYTILACEQHCTVSISIILHQVVSVRMLTVCSCRIYIFIEQQGWCMVKDESKSRKRHMIGARRHV